MNDGLTCSSRFCVWVSWASLRTRIDNQQVLTCTAQAALEGVMRVGWLSLPFPCGGLQLPQHGVPCWVLFFCVSYCTWKLATIPLNDCPRHIYVQYGMSGHHRGQTLAGART